MTRGGINSEETLSGINTETSRERSNIHVPVTMVTEDTADSDSDLYGHILRLCGSHLPPGWLLVVVHLVAHRLLPADGFGLQGNMKRGRKS